MDATKTGEFLRTLRKAKGLTQEEVAEQLYLSPKTVSRWESGASKEASDDVVAAKKEIHKKFNYL